MNSASNDNETGFNSQQLRDMQEIKQFFVEQRSRQHESIIYTTPTRLRPPIADLVNDEAFRRAYLNRLSATLNEDSDGYIYRVDFVVTEKTIPCVRVTRFRITPSDTTS